MRLNGSEIYSSGVGAMPSCGGGPPSTSISFGLCDATSSSVMKLSVPTTIIAANCSKMLRARPLSLTCLLHAPGHEVSYGLGWLIVTIFRGTILTYGSAKHQRYVRKRPRNIVAGHQPGQAASVWL